VSQPDVPNSDKLEVLPYRPSSASPYAEIGLTILASVAVLLAFPLGVLVSILMESRTGVFSHAAAERGGFAVFAFGEALGSAAGWIAYRKARRSASTSASRAKPARWLAFAAALAGAAGTIIALALLCRGAVA